MAAAPTGPLAWEPPYAVGAALEKAKRQINKQTNKHNKTVGSRPTPGSGRVQAIGAVCFKPGPMWHLLWAGGWGPEYSSQKVGTGQAVRRHRGSPASSAWDWTGPGSGSELGLGAELQVSGLVSTAPELPEVTCLLKTCACTRTHHAHTRHVRTFACMHTCVHKRTRSKLHLGRGFLDLESHGKRL